MPRVHTTGSGDTTLLFVHGWLCSSAFWRHQLALADTYRIVRFDLPGHGERVAEPVSPAEVTMEALADEVVRAAEDAGADRLVLVGHSMGGQLAAMASPKLGRRLRGIVGVDSFENLSRYGESSLRRTLTLLPFRLAFRPTVRLFVRLTCPRGADPSVRRWIQGEMTRPAKRVAIAAASSYAALDDRRLSASITAPVVGIQSMDPISPVFASDPRVHTLEMPGCGHFPMLTTPVAFNARLREAIEALDR
ncbi:MAG: alpha/beta hydrolase [Myxococcota bacterium]|nr:alpha/beta hydrolase [Myxococcota bacterium]